jgi:hypothetical protein
MDRIFFGVGIVIVGLAGLNGGILGWIEFFQGKIVLVV